MVSNHGLVGECDLAIGNPPTSGTATNTTDWLVARYGDPVDAKNAAVTSSAKHVGLRASHWKLDRLTPLLPRITAQAEINGDLNADASLVLTEDQAEIDWSWEGIVSIEQLLVAGIDAIKNDKLALASVELRGQAAATQGRLAVQDLKLTTDVGDFTATGDFPLDRHSQQSPWELVQSLLSDEDYHIDGRVDLKKLAALLPQTLRIREGIEITSGDVKVQFVGVAANGVRRWSGVAGIVGLNAVKQGKKISWDKPIAARVNAHRDRGAIVVDVLQCKSDFLQITGDGTLDDARFTASGDLSKLLLNVERFVDLGLDELSGQMQVNGELRRDKNDHVALTSKIVLNDFAYVVSKNNVWRELNLELSVVAAGQTDDTPALININSGEVHLTSGVDKLDLILQTPIDLKSLKPVYSATATMKGSLASWQSRTRPFVTVAGWRFAGDVNLATQVSIDADQIDVSQLDVSLKQFEAFGPEWLIKDPEFKLQTTAHWDSKSQRGTSPKISLNGKSLTVDVANLDLTYAPQGLISLTGTASYRAELTELSSWKNQAIKEPAYYLIGALSGTADIARQNNSLVGNVDAQVEKFIVAGQGVGANGQPQWVALWKEPQLKLSSKGAYDVASDQFAFDNSHFDVEGLSIGTSGKLDQCSTNRRIDMAGELAYDWELLLKRLSPQLAQQIQLTGKGRRPFSIKGGLTAGSGVSIASISTPAVPVSFQTKVRSTADNNPTTASAGLVDLNGQAGIGWETARLYGFSAGAADLSTQIERGVCRFTPIDLVLNDGKLHVTPTIYFDRSPFLLSLPQERLIDELSLTKELCSSSLKFVAPALADATQVDGKITVDLGAASLPLSDPSTGSANGVLSIHRAQAKPGPLSLQMIGVINQIRSILTRQPGGNPNRDQVWIEMTEQQVPFKLENDRVYHQGMTFLVTKVLIRTSGSVGLDNTLDLVAEIPIKDEWLGNNKALAGMKGKTVKVPITGTTSRPQVDPSAMADLARQLSGAAIDGLLDDKVGDGLKGVINNGIDKLLRGKR